MRESSYDAVNIFRSIKEEVKCDDMTAAILTLAQSIPRGLSIYVEQGEEYALDRVGKDVADAIEAVTKNGAIQVSTNGSQAANTPATARKPKPKKRTF